MSLNCRDMNRRISGPEREIGKAGLGGGEVGSGARVEVGGKRVSPLGECGWGCV